MTLIGYATMCEQTGPKQLVRDVAIAEEASFDFAVISDHYFPWPEAQGHSRTHQGHSRTHGACSARPGLALRICRALGGPTGEVRTGCGQRRPASLGIPPICRRRAAAGSSRRVLRLPEERAGVTSWTERSYSFGLELR
jgi:hypothetical protein